MGDWVGRTLAEGRAPVNNGRASAGSPWELCEDLPGEKIRTRDVGKDGRRVDAWMYLAGDWLGHVPSSGVRVRHPVDVV